MGMNYDFYVRLNEGDDLGKEILKHVFVDNRIKRNKPTIIFIGGGSGEGKSLTALSIMLAIEPGMDIEKQIIYTPYEYPIKSKWILFDKAAANHHVLCFMESRELIKSKLWYSIINQAISDVNAMSRTIKPLIFIVCSQDISDIDKDQRKTLNFIGFCNRYERTYVSFELYRVWKPQHLIDNPKTRLKKLSGFYETPLGEKHAIYLSRIRMTMPPEELVTAFNQLDFEKKSDIVMKKLENLERVLQAEMPKATRLEQLAEMLVREPAALSLALERNKKGNYKIRSNFLKLQNLSTKDGQAFGDILFKRLMDRGLMASTMEGGSQA